jgi:hypothetical protein
LNSFENEEEEKLESQEVSECLPFRPDASWDVVLYSTLISVIILSKKFASIKNKTFLYRNHDIPVTTNCILNFQYLKKQPNQRRGLL